MDTFWAAMMTTRGLGAREESSADGRNSRRLQKKKKKGRIWSVSAITSYLIIENWPSDKDRTAARVLSTSLNRTSTDITSNNANSSSLMMVPAPLWSTASDCRFWAVGEWLLPCGATQILRYESGEKQDIT